MNIPITDLTVQYNTIKDEIDSAIFRVLETGRYILGTEVEAFEREIADYCQTRYAVAVASGTDALILSLKACGIKPGDEVITTPFTFAATTEAIIHCGATPVFVDIDPRSYAIDPTQIESEITPRTKALLPVHLFGNPVDMDAILEISRKYRLKIVEDCAQSLGAVYNAKMTGSMGNVGCLSFFPSKNLGAFGDGGMVVTNDRVIAEKVQMLRNHGAVTTYHHLMTGFNSRLDAIQAAILRIKLKYIEKWNAERREVSSLYTEKLRHLNGIITPATDANSVSSANYYTIRIDKTIINRDELRQFLSSQDIDTAVYYPLALHLQDAFVSLGYSYGDFPESEAAQEEVLSLPIFPEITHEQIDQVVTCITEYLVEKGLCHKQRTGR